MFSAVGFGDYLGASGESLRRVGDGSLVWAEVEGFHALALAVVVVWEPVYHIGNIEDAICVAYLVGSPLKVSTVKGVSAKPYGDGLLGEVNAFRVLVLFATGLNDAVDLYPFSIGGFRLSVLVYFCAKVLAHLDHGRWDYRECDVKNVMVGEAHGRLNLALSME